MMAATYLAYLLLYDRLVARARPAAPAGEAA